MTAIAATADSGLAERARWWISDAWVVMIRNLRRIPRQPDMLFFVTLQPIMFIVLFRYVFGGAIEQSLSGQNYAQYLMPGIFVQTVLFGSVGTTALSVVDDMKRGIMDRFRSLPMSRSSVLLGRTLADVVVNSLTVTIMVIVGILVGFRFEGSFWGAAAGIALMLFMGFAFSWVAALIGLSASSVETVQTAGFIWLFPLTFASSAFVPIDDMPTWLRTFAEYNPVSITVDALRSWFNGTPVGDAGWQAFAWSLAILLVFMTLSVAKFRRASLR